MDPRKPFRKVAARKRRALLHGEELNASNGPGGDDAVIPMLERLLGSSDSERTVRRLTRYMSAAPCPACEGTRLRPEALSVTVSGLNIRQVQILLGHSSLRSTEIYTHLSEPLRRDLRQLLGDAFAGLF